jgi:phosphate transport system permease protein
MSDPTSSQVDPGGPVTPARPLRPSRSPRGRVLVDALARRVVTAGGLVIILSILAILLVIAAQVVPLFRAPTATPAPTVAGLPPAPLLLGADEYLEVAHLASPSGVALHRLADGSVLPGGVTQAVAAVAGDARTFALGLADGRILPCSVDHDTTYLNESRQVSASLSIGEALVARTDGRPADLFAFVATEDGPLAVARIDSNRVAVLSVTESAGLIGGTTREEVRSELVLPAKGEISALALDHRGDFAFAGTAGGELHVINLVDKSAPTLLAFPMPATHGRPARITLLALLLGDRTLVVGDAQGRVSTWQLLQRGTDARLMPMRAFTSHAGAVTGFARSERNKGFATSDATGQVFLHYGTTGRTLLQLAAPGPVSALALTPKGDALLGISTAGTIARWTLHNPHPEITWSTLFGKVLYEGYEHPEYVWQSTGGTDDFEAKFSLTPLMFGTIKGTVFALLFAIPLALLGALYASQFMHPNLKQWVKPVVEIMAALPSVVLGFVAGLWLAPVMERHVPGLLIMPLVVGVAILVTLAGWKTLPVRLSRHVRPGWEMLLLVPVTLGGAWLALALGGSFEQLALGGDYRHWIQNTLNLTFDQRNSMVVGFAMGFAVVPIIFTIAEDSLSSVPHHLRAASLALGATPWQTAVRVILPTASPGIFSAVMIGLGRAVGETMIVLMATGNTPVMNWSIFNGFRALSANIAVELPEAPDGSTLFRVLFLAALLLYLLTFALNTVAELIRLRLREKYRVL